MKIYKNEANSEVILHILKPNSRILDIGCGAGNNAKILSDLGHIVDGITISAEEINLAKEFCEKVILHDCENGLPKDLTDKYDYIICSHVIEHICQPRKLLLDIRNYLKDDGEVIIAIPNLFYFKTRLMILRGEFDYQETGILDNTHYKWYTFETIKKILVLYKFDCKIRYATGDIPFFCKFKFVKRTLIYYKTNKFLLDKFPGFLGYQIVVVASKLNF